MVSNTSLTALEWFSLQGGFPRTVTGGPNWNDVFRWVYDTLFDLNIEVDIVPDTATADRLAPYAMLVAPALYVASESTTQVLTDYVRGGGHLVTTFRTGVSDENLQVVTDRQPHGLSRLLGLGTDQFTRPDGARLRLEGTLADGDADSPGLDSPGLSASVFMELLTPVADAEGDQPVEVLARYDHRAWAGPAIATRRAGSGSITHVATMASPQVLGRVLWLVAERAGVVDWAQDLAGHVTVRRGVNGRGHGLTYLLNHQGGPVDLTLPVCGVDVLGTVREAGSTLAKGTPVRVPAWGVLVIEGN